MVNNHTDNVRVPTCTLCDPEVLLAYTGIALTNIPPGAGWGDLSRIYGSNFGVISSGRKAPPQAENWMIS